MIKLTKKPKCCVFLVEASDLKISIYSAMLVWRILYSRRKRLAKQGMKNKNESLDIGNRLSVEEIKTNTSERIKWTLVKCAFQYVLFAFIFASGRERKWLIHLFRKNSSLFQNSFLFAYIYSIVLCTFPASDRLASKSR